MRTFSRNARSGGKKKDARAPLLTKLWWVWISAAIILVLFSPWKRALENFFHPYLVLPAHGTAALSDATLLLRSKRDLAQELEHLRIRNFELQQEARAVEKLTAENRDLRGLLGLAPKPDFRYLACDVVLRDPWLWEGGFTIGSGSEEGLEPGLAVIAAAPDNSGRAVLLGVIESTAKHSARVISVVNSEFRLSVRLPESDAIGFLNAAENTVSGGGATVSFLPANTTFALHEPVYTTGFEALIPEGLYIGSLDAIEPNMLPFGNRLYRSALMRPAADLQKLRTVMVASLKERREPSK